MELKDDLVEWVEVKGIRYAAQQEVAEHVRELEAELAALRQQQGEPVAWLYESKHTYWIAVIRDKDKSEGVSETPLYREAAPRVPEGWKLVPNEPTGRMIDEAAPYLPLRETLKIEHVYRAMLAAAPEG